MADLLMHPRADSLTFLFTTQGERERELRKEERKEKESRTLFVPFNHPGASCSDSLLLSFTGRGFFFQACWFDLGTVRQCRNSVE